jgi:hypothetical protein
MAVILFAVIDCAALYLKTTVLPVLKIYRGIWSATKMQMPIVTSIPPFSRRLFGFSCGSHQTPIAIKIKPAGTMFIIIQAGIGGGALWEGESPMLPNAEKIASTPTIGSIRPITFSTFGHVTQ